MMQQPGLGDAHFGSNIGKGDGVVAATGKQPHGRVEDLLASARRQGILAGVPLGTWYDDLQDCLLISVTEKRTKAEIDALVRALATADSDDVLEASRPCEVES